MSVQLKVKCTKVSQNHHWNKKPDGTPMINTCIELFLEYSNDPKNQNYPFSEISGGTKFELQTTNEDAAKQFQLGKNYNVLIDAAE
jgi:hypothetical protein